MRLKSFQASSMPQAMKLVVADLGENAVIVSSRTMDNGDVRVTAALDTMTESDWEAEQNAATDLNDAADAIAERAALFGGIKDYDDLPEEGDEIDIIESSITSDVIEIVTSALMRHGVPAKLADKILTRVENSGIPDPFKALVEVFIDLFDFDPIPTTAYERPVMLVGQPGAGKTLTVAKLAARAVMNDLNPVVITADIKSAGGVAQLAAFTKVLKLPLIKVNSPEQLKQAIDDNKNADQIIIDCPGLNAFDAGEMKELNTYIKVAPMDLLLALPAGGDADESAEIARAFSILGARWMVPTRIDISRRIGGVLSAADQAGLGFAGMGNDASVAEGLVDLSAEILAKAILPKSKKMSATQGKKEKTS